MFFLFCLGRALESRRRRKRRQDPNNPEIPLLWGGVGGSTDVKMNAEKAMEELEAKDHIPGLQLTPEAERAQREILKDASTLPPVKPCCILCDLLQAPSQSAFNSILNSNGYDPQTTNQAGSTTIQTTFDERKLRWEKTRKVRRMYRMMGLDYKPKQDCCVICPFTFNPEGPNVNDIDPTSLSVLNYHSAGTTRNVRTDTDYTPRVRGGRRGFGSHRGHHGHHDHNMLMMETESTLQTKSTGPDFMYPRLLRHEHPKPCCPMCASQFLVAHLYPQNPFTQDDTSTPYGQLIAKARLQYDQEHGIKEAGLDSSSSSSSTGAAATATGGATGAAAAGAAAAGATGAGAPAGPCGVPAPCGAPAPAPLDLSIPDVSGPTPAVDAGDAGAAAAPAAAPDASAGASPDAGSADSASFMQTKATLPF